MHTGRILKMLDESNPGRYKYSPEVLSLTIGGVQIHFQVHTRPNFARHAFPYPASEANRSRSRGFVEHGCKPSRSGVYSLRSRLPKVVLLVPPPTRRNGDEVQYPAVYGECEVT
jgi:hypothetical protein